MANEFKHKDPGTELTQAEFIASDGTGHIFDSQAQGDILYASSATVLARLAKATDGNVLELASGLPAWTASPTIGSTSWANANHAHAASNSGGTLTTLGTVTTGVWQGTAIASGYIAADAITGAKIADDAIDSEHYTDGSIDNEHLADDAVDSDEIAAGAIDTAHIADNQVTLAKMAGITRGSIIYGDASGDPAALAKGSSDYVLTSDGTDIAWAAAAGGGNLILIGTAVASNSATLGITGLDSTYDSYLILLSDLIPATDGTTPRLLVGDSGGIVTTTGRYRSHTSISRTDIATYEGVLGPGGDGFGFATNVGNAAGEGVGAAIWLSHPGDGTMTPMFHGTTGSMDSAGNIRGGQVLGHYYAAITLTQLQFRFASGNITQGRMTVFGAKHA